MTAFPNVDIANKWAKQVVSGKIPSCKWVKLACQRHLNDLIHAKKKEFPFKFEPKLAEKKIAFIELLPHTKGEWAMKRMKISLEPWQKFGIACTFGWTRKKDGYRRFRESYWEVPRKNGKSAIAAGVALNMFANDGEFGSEVYAGATTEKQAWEVFKPARLMAIRSPEFIEAAGILINAGSLEIPDEGSVFEPITGDPPDGQSPHCAVVDEFHEHQTSALYDTMQTGMGARRQPMIFTITTAGFDIEGPCYDLRSRVQEMLLGTVPDEELFGWIMTRNILSSTVKQHTLVFSLTEANGSCDGFRITTDGIYSSVSNSSSRHGYKGTITPAIVKTNAMEITWRINLSWGRYVS